MTTDVPLESDARNAFIYDHPRASPFSEFKEELKETREVASNARLNARRD